MNALEAVTQEVCKRVAAVASAPALPPEVAELVLRLFLIGEPRDAAGNVAMSAERIAGLVNDVVQHLRGATTTEILTVELQSAQSLLHGWVYQRQAATAAHLAGARRLIDIIVSKKDVAEVISSISLFILHQTQMLDGDTESGGPVAAAREADREQSRKETLAVLLSVLPRTQVGAFIAQQRAEKDRQLRELWRIVWGIRIFDRQTGRRAGGGGGAVTDLPATASDAARALLEFCSQELSEMEERCSAYAAALQSPSLSIPAKQRRALADGYLFSLQYRSYLRTLSVGAHATFTQVHDHLLPHLDALLRDLTSLVEQSSQAPANNTGDNGGGEQTVPKSVIYPLFISLADAFEELRDAQHDVLDLTSALERLADFAQRCSHEALESLNITALRASLVEDKSVDQKRVAEYVQNLRRQTNLSASSGGGATTDVQLVMSNAAIGADDAGAVDVRRSLALHGICITSLLMSNDASHPPVPLEGKVDTAASDFPGFLKMPFSRAPHQLYINGTESATTAAIAGGGAAAAEETSTPRTVGTNAVGESSPVQVFCFSSERALRWAAAEAIQRPFSIERLFPLIREQPALGCLMDLDAMLPDELYLSGTRTVVRQVVADYNPSVGTQTGQIDPYTDWSYEWNEWALRRQALKLANLKNMRTHSTQTVASHFRRDAETQMYPLRDTGVQTMVDAAVQPPRTVQYIKGLRGSPSSRLEVVKKTIQY